MVIIIMIIMIIMIMINGDDSEAFVHNNRFCVMIILNTIPS